MRKLRDETVLRNLLWRSINSVNYSKNSYSDDLFETELQDSICMYEREIKELEEKIQNNKRCVNLLITSHFEFAKDRRSFIEKLYEKIRPEMLEKAKDWSHIKLQVQILDNYLDSESTINNMNEKEKDDESEYLEKVRQVCIERKPWLPRKVFDPALIEAAIGDYEAEEL